MEWAGTMGKAASIDMRPTIDLGAKAKILS